MTENLTIEDLEKHSGLTTRTLHYYMAKGLLPGPETRGKNASYTQEHLDRLDLILSLKNLNMPLEKIKGVMDKLTPAEVKLYLDQKESQPEQFTPSKPESKGDDAGIEQGSALDYIKGLEDAYSTHKGIAESRATPFVLHSQKNNFLKFDSNKNATQQQAPRSEIWRRIVLTDGVELNFRDTSDKEDRYRIERLLSFARSLFDE